MELYLHSLTDTHGGFYLLPSHARTSRHCTASPSACVCGVYGALCTQCLVLSVLCAVCCYVAALCTV
jgi:hypothetical protein